MASKKEEPKMATAEMFEMLHGILTKELIARIQSGEATTADLRAAIDWLAKNDITGVPVEDSPLASLAGLIPELTFEDVQEEIT
jgi:hypothetical protein